MSNNEWNGEGKTAKPINYDTVFGMLMDVKEKHGHETAKNIVLSAGKSERMKDIPSEHYAAVVEACEIALGVVTATVAHTLDRDALEAACEALAALPEHPTISTALNTIYDAWLKGGFMLPMTVKADTPPAEEY